MKTEMRTGLISKDNLGQSKFLNRKSRDLILEFKGKSFRYLESQTRNTRWFSRKD